MTHLPPLHHRHHLWYGLSKDGIFEKVFVGNAVIYNECIQISKENVANTYTNGWSGCPQALARYQPADVISNVAVLR